MGVSNSSPRFTRTLPAPSAVHADGFVFLLSTAWFTQAGGDSGSPIDGGATSLANGGGNMMAFSDVLCTNRLPIHVVTFVAGVSPDALVYVRTPSYTAGDTITIGRDDTQTTQPLPAAAFGQYDVYQDWQQDGVVTNFDTLEDNTGNGNTLTYTTGASFNASGFIGAAADFTIPPAGAQRLSSSVSVDSSKSCRVSCWIYRRTDRSANNFNENYFGLYTPGLVTDGIICGIYQNKLVIYTVGGNTTSRTGASTLALNTWYKLDVVYNQSSNTVRHYVNGVLDGDVVTSYTDTVNVTGGDLSWGGTTNTSDIGIDGMIDEARFTTDITTQSAEKIADEYSNQSDPDNFGTSSEWSVPSGTGVNLLKVGSLDVVDVKLYKGAVYTPVTLYLGDTLVWQEE